MLYCNDFNVAVPSVPLCSEDGSYTIPLELPFYRRKQLPSTKTILLTAPGISTNQILLFSIPGKMKGAVEQIEAVDYESSFVRIVLGVYGFLRDYPSSLQAVNVMEHISGAPCTQRMYRTLCHQKKYSLPGYAYVSDVHYGHPFSSRPLLLSSLSLMFFRIGGSGRQYLRMKDGRGQTENDFTQWPLLQLSVKLNIAKNVIKNLITGDLLFRSSFDLYFQNVEAPDLLLAEIAKRILEVYFLQ